MYVIRQSFVENIREGREYFYEIIAKLVLFIIMNISGLFTLYFWKLKNKEVVSLKSSQNDSIILVDTAPELVRFLLMITVACLILFLTALILGGLYLLFSEKQKTIKKASAVKIKKLLGATDRQIKMEQLTSVSITIMVSFILSWVISYPFFQMAVSNLKEILPF